MLGSEKTDFDLSGRVEASLALGFRVGEGGATVETGLRIDDRVLSASLDEVGAVLASAGFAGLAKGYFSCPSGRVDAGFTATLCGRTSCDGRSARVLVSGVVANGCLDDGSFVDGVGGSTKTWF